MKAILEVLKKYYICIYSILLVANIVILSYYYPLFLTKNRLFDVLMCDFKIIYIQLLKWLFNIFIYSMGWFGLCSLLEGIKNNTKYIICLTIQIFIFICLLLLVYV